MLLACCCSVDWLLSSLTAQSRTGQTISAPHSEPIPVSSGLLITRNLSFQKQQRNAATKPCFHCDVGRQQGLLCLGKGGKKNTTTHHSAPWACSEMLLKTARPGMWLSGDSRCLLKAMSLGQLAISLGLVSWLQKHLRKQRVSWLCWGTLQSKSCCCYFSLCC